MQKYVGLCILMALLLLALGGCASTAQRTQELLDKNHVAMSDDELLQYNFQLNDQIAREERDARGTSVGVGLGRGPVGVGVSTGVTTRPLAGDLRDRRNEVRAELSRRGLRP